MLENHITLWEEKKIDLSITAFGHFVPELRKHGVRYILIRSTLEHVKEAISGIINEITILKLKNRSAVVACLSIETEHSPSEEQLYELKVLASRFLRNLNLADTAQISEGSVRLYTTYGSFKKITSNAQNCTLLKYLEECVIDKVKIGWGSGYEYYQANENADKAHRQAKAYTGSCSFFINEEENKYAQTVFEKRETGKGRPQKYYELLFLDKEGRNSEL